MNIIEFLTKLPPWQRNFLTFLLGGLSAFSQAPYDFSLLLFITLPLFIVLFDCDVALDKALSKGSLWTAFKRGWWFGFGYLLANLWWIGAAFLVNADHFIYFMPFAVIALPMALSIYYGLGAMIARIFWQKDGWAIAALAFGFGLSEFLRGTLFTGFPWSSLGYSAAPSPLFMQSAAILGFYSFNLLAILTFATPAILLRPNAKAFKNSAWLLLGILLFSGHFIYGYFSYDRTKLTHLPSPIIRIIQPNILQKDKWDPTKKQQNFEQLLKATSANKEPVDVILWPESTFPFYLQETPHAQQAIGDILPPNSTLIAGGLRFENNDRPSRYDTYNSLLVINDQGQIVDHYDKTHLLPFGEYLPFQEFLENLGITQLTQLPGGFSYGERRKPIVAAGLPPFLPLICYEIIFPNQLFSKEPAWQGAPDAPRSPDGPTWPNGSKWIVNLTNDGWFGDTPGPRQHLRQSQLRAVEERRVIFRAANSGISAIINPLGEIEKAIDLNQMGAIDGQISLYHGFITKLPKNFILLLLNLLILLSLLFKMKKNK